MIKEKRQYFDLSGPTVAPLASSAKQTSCLKHHLGEAGSHDSYYKRWRVRCGKWCWLGANGALQTSCPVSRGKNGANRMPWAPLDRKESVKKGASLNGSFLADLSIKTWFCFIHMQVKSIHHATCTQTTDTHGDSTYFKCSSLHLTTLSARPPHLALKHQHSQTYPHTLSHISANEHKQTDTHATA